MTNLQLSNPMIIIDGMKALIATISNIRYKYLQYGLFDGIVDSLVIYNSFFESFQPNSTIIRDSLIRSSGFNYFGLFSCHFYGEVFSSGSVSFSKPNIILLMV